MIKILFICHGNICRSPLAEFVMKEYIRQAGREKEFLIDSMAVSPEELGNPIYPPVRRLLRENGIPFSEHYATVMTRRDYDRYDHIIAMDRSNLKWISRIIGTDPEGKVSLLLHWAGREDSVADPYYSGDFGATWEDVTEGCKALLEALTKQPLYP